MHVIINVSNLTYRQSHPVMPGDILKAVPYLPDKVGMFLFKLFQILVIINRCFCDQTFHQTTQVLSLIHILTEQCMYRETVLIQ